MAEGVGDVGRAGTNDEDYQPVIGLVRPIILTFDQERESGEGGKQAQAPEKA